MKITLKYLTPGMNGADGLIRQHFRDAGKLKDKIKLDILSQRPRGFKCINTPVKVVYTRYTAHLMDWDNAAASFKHIGDALQAAGILSDDSPEVIAEFIPRQIKCAMKDRRTEIEITDSYKTMIQIVKKIFSAPGWAFSQKDGKVICRSEESIAVCEAIDDALVISTDDLALRDDIHDEFGGVRNGDKVILSSF